MIMLKKIISGGQTGADRAGLAAGKALHLVTGGWVPRGYRTENGPDESLKMYHMTEHPESTYPPRTKANVLDSDGTILFGNVTSPGCSLTIRLCKQHHRPFICNPSVPQFRKWLEDERIETLNVAGNRERTNPGIFDKVFTFLVEAIGEEI